MPRDRKTRADIVTMNAALSNAFLANLPKAIREMYKPTCMKQPNTIFLHMFVWFITKCGKTMTKDREENRPLHWRILCERGMLPNG